MKTLHGVLMIAAFITAIASSVAYGTRSTQEVYGQNFLGICVLGDAYSLEEGCGVVGFYRCTVYLPVTDEIVPAFQSTATICALPFRRW